MGDSYRITSKYEHALQSIYWDIGNRGLCVDLKTLAEGERIVDAEIKRNLSIASNQWGCVVFVGKENTPDMPLDPEDEPDDEDEDDIDPADVVGPGGFPVNINATKGKFALLKKLKDLGYDVPTITKKNKENDYEQRESAGELAIQKMLSQNQFNYPGGDPALRAILQVRELGKLKTGYFNARFYKYGQLALFLSNYNVAGTVSGRRGSRRHTFGFGNNAQNFPEHSKTAYLFRRAVIARPGNIFLFIDQMQAEDWPVSALAYNLQALSDLKSGVDRHSKLASVIFYPKVIPPKGSPQWDKALHDQDRYLGKKTRHASNYDMTAPRLSDVLAQEAGLSMSVGVCQVMLDKVASADPSVKGVFHKYVQDQISRTRILITPSPFFRERQFLGCRPNDINSSIFKEAYSYIPQSTVGDNTGNAVLFLETKYKGESYIVQEGHDSLIQDIRDTVDNIYKVLLRTGDAFNRIIRFHNGIEINIPIEAKIGYNLDEAVDIKEFSRKGVAEAHEKLQNKVKKSNVTQIAVGF